ncbi:hypothetical protein ACGFX4_11250 [Kitasatospora sp. NPDC048365]|uniref:hypothetical protein n=1 Tax=Kitasatospora sp. NPDC048365 TaxID=3364050 RepID=UPI00371EF170
MRVGSMLDLPLEDGELAGIAAFYSLIRLQPDERPCAYEEFACQEEPPGDRSAPPGVISCDPHLVERCGHRHIEPRGNARHPSARVVPAKP